MCIDLGAKGKFTVSIVDAANPVVFCKAEELGLQGTELPTEVEGMPDVLRLIEEIRSVAAEKVGIVCKAEVATKESPAIPKIGFVSKARDYQNSEGKIVPANSIDFVARLAAMQKMHRAYMVTGGVCTGTAAKIEGTVVWDLLDDKAKKSNVVRIGHPYGVMDVQVTLNPGNTAKPIQRVGVGRTARRLLEGYAFVPRSIFADGQSLGKL